MTDKNKLLAHMDPVMRTAVNSLASDLKRLSDNWWDDFVLDNILFERRMEFRKKGIVDDLTALEPSEIVKIYVDKNTWDKLAELRGWAVQDRDRGFEFKKYRNLLVYIAYLLCNIVFYAFFS